ncbi:MAG: sugar phosphate nucleotidyltransferase [Candidatus Thalassarchaeaceae archaeon]
MDPRGAIGFSFYYPTGITWIGLSVCLKCTVAERRLMEGVRDAIILAGGRGTRMLPASLYMPKEAMPLVDTPILNHLVWEAVKAGVSRVHLVLSERKRAVLQDFLGNISVLGDGIRDDLPPDALKLGVDGVSVIPHVQYDPGGVADAISVALDHIDGPFLVLLGDMVLLQEQLGPKHSGSEYASSASSELVDAFESSGLPSVGVFPVEREEVCNYGVVRISKGLVEEIIEKPTIEDAPGNYVLCGRYVLPENTKEILQKYPISEFGELQSIQLLNHIMEDPGLCAVKLDHMKMYDSGDPLVWLKSQIDHALRRKDIGEDLSNWIEERLSD